MKVILVEDVKGLGKKGDVVTAKEGYAHNFLMAKNLAIPYTESNLKKLEKERADVDRKKDKIFSEANEKRALLEGKKIFLKVESNNGKIFGAVGHNDIVNAIMDQLSVEIDKKKILTPNIKTLGLHEISIKLHQNVIVSMLLEVI